MLNHTTIYWTRTGHRWFIAGLFLFSLTAMKIWSSPVFFPLTVSYHRLHGPQELFFFFRNFWLLVLRKTCGNMKYHPLTTYFFAYFLQRSVERSRFVSLQANVVETLYLSDRFQRFNTLTVTMLIDDFLLPLK